MERTRDYYQREYLENERSLHDIAEEHRTHANVIRREILGFGIQTRNRSEAQKVALKTGRHIHPTKGMPRPPEVKLKISTSVIRTINYGKDKGK